MTVDIDRWTNFLAFLQNEIQRDASSLPKIIIAYCPNDSNDLLDPTKSLLATIHGGELMRFQI